MANPTWRFTASFFVNTDLDGNQIASFYTGAMARARELSLLDVVLDDARADCLVTISPNDPEAMTRYPAECQEMGIPYLYDPSQQIIRLSGEDLKVGLQGCDLLVVNEYEFDMMREKTGMGDEAIQAAPGRACIVTLAEEGARIWANGEVYDVPVVPPKQVRDPTGVGDAFRAGLVKGLALALPWDLAGRMGALAATYCLEQYGTQNHTYSLAEFVTRFRCHFDDAGALDALVAS